MAVKIKKADENKKVVLKNGNIATISSVDPTEFYGVRLFESYYPRTVGGACCNKPACPWHIIGVLEI